MLTGMEQYFEATKEFDFSFSVKGLSRFRANVFMQRGVVTMSIRRIPYDILLPGQLGLPDIVREIKQNSGRQFDSRVVDAFLRLRTSCGRAGSRYPRPGYSAA